MTMYHHLHCIVGHSNYPFTGFWYKLLTVGKMRVHHFLHREHYWPNATAEDMYLLRAHNCMFSFPFVSPRHKSKSTRPPKSNSPPVHCLDTLRQAIMCQGDTSLITFRWGETQAIPLGNFSSEHRCKSWEALDAWNKERFVDVFQPGLVVHPKFGPPYVEKFSTHGTGVVVEEGKIENGQGTIEARKAHSNDDEDEAAEVEAAKAREKMELAWSRKRVN